MNFDKYDKIDDFETQRNSLAVDQRDRGTAAAGGPASDCVPSAFRTTCFRDKSF